ncbi:MAG: tetratricopeptide repeat protein [Prevotellaceae bacterium]|jgi:tetratricopeptide (TPR) repeat protein|nr:tetratricopeptide repeat protein [Prevotellaceae bacterium]
MFYGICAYTQEDNKPATCSGDSVLTLQDEKYNLITNAKKLSFEGAFDKAATLYGEAVKIDPKCDACHYELANILIYMDKEQEAKENAEAAYNLDPDNPWFALLYGRLCFHFKEYDKAQKLFRKILVHHGDKQEVWFGLASAYEEQEMFQQAIGVLDSMAIRFGDSDDISYRVFNVSMDLGNYEKAVAAIKKVVNNYPNDPRYTTLLADAYAEMGNDSLAIETYSEIIKENDSFAPAMLGRAELYRKKGQFVHYFKSLQQYAGSKAIQPETKAEYLNLVLKIPSFAGHFKSNIDTIFAILSTVHPVSMELKYMQARYFVATQRPELSIVILGQLTDMDGNNKDVWLSLLALEYSLKMFGQLEQSSQKAIDSDPGYAAFYMYAALATWSKKQVKQAIAILEKGMAKARYDSVFMDNALSFLGDMYFSIEKPKKAFAYYEKALKNNPDNATVLNNYAYYLCLTKSKNMDKAYTMSKKAIELESSNPSFLDTYAYILFLQGKYAEAKKMFRKALAVGGDESAVVLDHYADTLDKLGERTIAEIYWSQALDKPDCVNPEQIKKKLKGN